MAIRDGVTAHRVAGGGYREATVISVQGSSPCRSQCWKGKKSIAALTDYTGQEVDLNDLNTVMVEGNLARDPELKYTPSGTAICTFSIGTNRSYRKDGEWKKEVSFFDIVLWAKLAEHFAEKLIKGTRVRVIGSLKQERWETDGKTRSRVVIVADSASPVEYFSKRGGQNGTD